MFSVAQYTAQGFQLERHRLRRRNSFYTPKSHTISPVAFFKDIELLAKAPTGHGPPSPDLLEYALNTGEEREHPVEQILQLLADSAPKHKEHIMTVADQLRQQGMHEGVILGEKKGIEKGIEKVARSMLAKNADINFVAETTGLTVVQLEAIKSSLTIH